MQAKKILILNHNNENYGTYFRCFFIGKYLGRLGYKITMLCASGKNFDLSLRRKKIEANFIERVLEKFVMNVTALNNYLKCPLQFYFNNLVRVPSGKSESTEFGSAVHYALQKFFQLMQDNNQFPTKQQLIEDFEWYMKRHRENFTKEQFNRRMEYGGEVLSNYFNTYINEWNKVVVIERTIKNVIVNGVPLKGKLDKLEFNGKMVNVVDYKTGDVEKAKEKLLGPNEKQPDGGDYWRQAVFYKILVDNYDQKSWQVISSEFDFIEPDNKKKYRKEKIIITDADIATVKNQITTVWQKIQNHEFYKGCGKEECHWCKFVKQNELTVSIAEILPVKFTWPELLKLSPYKFTLNKLLAGPLFGCNKHKPGPAVVLVTEKL